MLLSLTVLVVNAITTTRRRPGRRPGDVGQATAEYALVLLGAATVALLLVAWATKTGKISALLDAILARILDQA